MEYEVIRNVTLEQVQRIEKEFHRMYRKDKISVVRANGMDIGFFVTVFIGGRLTLEYYLFSAFQHKGYGKEFVNIVTDYVGALYETYSTIYLLIYYENLPSRMVALKNGYAIDLNDWDFRDMVQEEMPDHYVYSKSNPYYKDKGQELKKIFKEKK